MNQIEKPDDLKIIFDEAMHEFPDMQMPATFTDTLMRKLEKRLAWRELFAEFGLKIGLVIGALAVLTAVMLFPGKNNDVPMLAYLVHNWHIVTVPAVIFLFTFFFDQVFLRFLFRRNRF